MNIKYLSFFAMMSYISVHATTVEEAIIAANINNKEWAAQQTDKKATDEKYSMSKKNFLPSVEGYFGLSSNKEEQTVNDFSGKLISKQTPLTASKQMGITIRENIFNGFQTRHTIEAAEHQSSAAFYVLRFNEEELILKVIKAYSDVWFTVQKVDALRKKEENFFKALTSQKSSLAVGMSTSSDVAAASANYQKAIYERINAETEWFSAASEFEKLTGLEAKSDMELPNIALKLPDSLDKLVNTAMKSNNAIMATKLQANAAIKILKATKGKLLPSCDLSLSAARNLTRHKSKNESKNDYIASLRITVPIFQNDPLGGNTYSQINIESQAAMKAGFVAADKVLEIKKECIVTWNNYISANAMINASKSAVQSAELSSESNIEEMALGMKPNSDVWVKENNLLESRIDLANSQRQKFVASIKLLALTGKLTIKSILMKINNKTKRATSVKVARKVKAQKIV